MIVKYYKKIVAIFLVCLTTWLTADDSEKFAAIDRLFSVLELEDRSFVNSDGVSVAMLGLQLMKMGLDQKDIEILSKDYSDSLSSNIEVYYKFALDETKREYAKLFTTNEINDLIEFLSSPVGRKYRDSFGHLSDMPLEVLKRKINDHTNEFIELKKPIFKKYEDRIFENAMNIARGDDSIPSIFLFSNKLKNIDPTTIRSIVVGGFELVYKEGSGSVGEKERVFLPRNESVEDWSRFASVSLYEAGKDIDEIFNEAMDSFLETCFFDCKFGLLYDLEGALISYSIAWHARDSIEFTLIKIYPMPSGEHVLMKLVIRGFGGELIDSFVRGKYKVKTKKRRIRN